MQLSMDVAADGDGRPDDSGVGLLPQHCDGSVGDELDLFFGDGLEALEVVNDLSLIHI